MVVSILHTGRVRGSRCAAQGSRCCGSAAMTLSCHHYKFVPETFSFLARNKSLIYMKFYQFVPLVPLVPAFLSSFTDLNVLLILSYKLNLNLKIVARTVRNAVTRINPHFLTFQFWHESWHERGTNCLFVARNTKSLTQMTTNRGS